MKLKKLVSALLVGTMLMSCVACGGDTAKTDKPADNNAGTEADAGASDDKAASGDKLVIWTLAKDLETFADYYTEQTGVECETVVIEPAEYPTKVQTALLGGAKEPDIIVGEPQMLEDMYDAGFFEDLNQAPYNAQDYADQIVDYVWDVGQDADGIQRAISYQITPAGMYYRRSIAKEVFGTDDPDEVGKYFKDYNTILQTAETLKQAGYKIFGSDGEMNFFSGDSAWVIDGTLNVDKGREEYMDLCVQLYQNEYTAFATQWSSPWYAAMAGEVPVLTAETNVWDDTELAKASENADMTSVFSFGLPAWGVLTLRDHAGDTAGDWGVCAGPSYGFSGGTYIGISSQSEKKEQAWDFVKFVTLNEDTADWWIEKSKGDTVSLKSALEKHKDDENETYGGEKLYTFWQEQAKGIDYSKVTRYDKAIGDAWAAAISSIKTGELSKEDAINTFYDTVESTYPEITVNR